MRRLRPERRDIRKLKGLCFSGLGRGAADEFHRNAVDAVAPGSGGMDETERMAVVETVFESEFLDVGERLRALREMRSWTEGERDAFFDSVRRNRQERARARGDGGYAEERMESAALALETMLTMVACGRAKDGDKVSVRRLRKRFRDASRMLLPLLANPESVLDYMALGRLCLRYGLPEAADEAFREAVLRRHDAPSHYYVEAVSGIGAAAEMGGAERKARRYFAFARKIAESSDDWRGWLPWADAYRQLAERG